MWKHAGAYLRRKKIRAPGQYSKTNVHGGKMWGSRKECKLTDLMAGTVMEILYESGKVGLDQLKQVRHSLSYAWYLRTGNESSNYPEVYAQFRSFDLTKLPGVRKPAKPTRIPTPQNLKTAFLRRWTRAHPQDFATFNVATLTSWDTHICGCRPNVDIRKLKLQQSLRQS